MNIMPSISHPTSWNGPSFVEVVAAHYAPLVPQSFASSDTSNIMVSYVYKANYSCSPTHERGEPIMDKRIQTGDAHRQLLASQSHPKHSKNAFGALGNHKDAEDCMYLDQS